MRKIQFQNGEYYHIYNRGVDKRRIFMDNKDYLRFLTGMREFNGIEPIGSLRDLENRRKQKQILKQTLGVCNSTDPEGLFLAGFIAYCLNPNHYHFLLKQITDNGISTFIGKLANGYTKYFNTKYNRSGSLFQGPFKSVHIKSDHQLIQLSCYIHGNPEIHKISKAENWIWSSYSDYLNKRNGNLCEKKIILNEFKSINEYKILMDSLIKDFAEQKDEIKESMLE